jgi:hypothetical protein
MAAEADEDTLSGIDACFGRRSYPAATVADRHSGKHLHAKRSRPAKEDEPKKREEGDRDGRESEVRVRTAGRRAGFFTRGK